MAAFTTMALLGLAAAGGALTSKKLAEKRAADAAKKAEAAAAVQKAGAALNAPGPTDGPQPPDASLARSEAQTVAMQAAVKQKRKARGGGTQLPVSSAPIAKAQLSTRTLLGY